MKLKKILAGLLATVMVVSLLPAMLFAVSATDTKLAGEAIYSRLFNENPASYAFDDDLSTYAKTYGLNEWGEKPAQNQYVGYKFPVSVTLTSVHVQANAVETQYAEWEPVTALQFSEDGEAWVNAYVFDHTAAIDVTVTSDQFTADVADLTINYARINRYIEKNPTEDIVPDSGHTAYWQTLSVYDLAFYGSNSVPVASFALTVDGQPIQAGNKLTATITAENNVDGFTSGKAVITYNANAFEFDAVSSDLQVVSNENGVLSLAFNKAEPVQGNGATLGTVTFTINKEAFSGSYDFGLTLSDVKNGENDVIVLSNGCSATVEGEDEAFYNLGTYAYNEEVVLIDTDYTPVNKREFISIVLEVKGLEGGKLKLGGVYVNANGIESNNSGNITEGETFPKDSYITEDGFYVLEIGSYWAQWAATTFNSIKKLAINQADTRVGQTEFVPSSENSDAEPTITYHALCIGKIDRTVNYYDTDEESILYTANITGGTTSRDKANLIALKTVDDYYESETVPVKESTIPKTSYEFDGWMDSEGNLVSIAYTDMDLYPHFKFIDNRPIYTITLKNYDDTEFAKVEVRENDVIKYTGKNPKKPSTETNSYDFTGWNTALDGTGEALTEETVATGDAVYYAQYVETERRYDVTFMAEDKETELYEVRVDKNAAATIPEELIPEKEATAEYTYTFEKWVDAEGKEVDLSKVATDLVVYASYKATENKYTVTFMDDDKETKLDEVKVSFGGKAEVAEPTKEETNGYTYKFVQWVDAEGKPADLSKIEADMTVYAEWETTLVKFSDVEKGKWYYTAVDYAYSNGILAGMSQTEFGINNETTRAMLVAVLYRQEGSPSVEGIKNPFTDVPEKEYYYNAVLWAYDNEVVFGLTDTTFGPNEKITREQLAAILYRYAKDVKKYDVSYDTKLSLSVFEDKNDISSYAQEPIKFGMDKGYISGSKDNGILKMNPKKGTTRAEMASMVMRFLEAEHTPAK